MACNIFGKDTETKYKDYPDSQEIGDHSSYGQPYKNYWHNASKDSIHYLPSEDSNMNEEESAHNREHLQYHTSGVQNANPKNVHLPLRHFNSLSNISWNRPSHYSANGPVPKKSFDSSQFTSISHRSDMISEDEIANMLQGYVNTSNSGSSSRTDMDREKYTLPPFSASITIPPIADKIDNSDISLQNRPASAISSSSVVSPLSFDGISNSVETNYNVHQSPSQMSSDSGFSGDYTQCLSIRVDTPEKANPLEHYVDSNNSLPCAKDITQRLLQPVNEVNTEASLQHNSQHYFPFGNHPSLHNNDIEENGCNLHFQRQMANVEHHKTYNTTHYNLSHYNHCLNDLTSKSEFNPNPETFETQQHNRGRVETSTSNLLPQMNGGTLPPFYDTHLSTPLTSHYEMTASVSNGQYLEESSGYNFECGNNVTHSNILYGEDLSHIVDQVLNSIDLQFSPPLSTQCQSKTTHTKQGEVTPSTSAPNDKDTSQSRISFNNDTKNGKNYPGGVKFTEHGRGITRNLNQSKELNNTCDKKELCRSSSTEDSNLNK